MISMLRSIARPLTSPWRLLVGKRAFGPQGLPSVVQVLSRSMHRDAFEQVLLTVEDYRDLLGAVSQVLGQPIETVATEVANILGLPLMTSVPPVEAAELKSLVPCYSFAEYRRMGSAPIVENGKVICVASVNPTTVDEQLPELSLHPRHLISWPVLSRFLAELEASVVVPTAPRSTGVAELLEPLLDAVQSHGGRSINLHLDSDNPEYSFVTDDGREAVGNISPSAVKGLRTFLSERSRHRELVADSWKVTSYTPQAVTLEIPSEQTSHGVVGSIGPQPMPAASPTHVESQPAEVTKATVAVAEQAPATPSVLVVEDQGIFAKVLHRFLERQGIDCTKASNGKDALKLLTRGLRPRLILSDMHMPEGNGLELLRKVQSSEDLRAIPFLLLTSDTDPELEASVIKAGAVGCLKKHEDPRVLTAYVGRLLSADGKGAQSLEQAE